MRDIGDTGRTSHSAALVAPVVAALGGGPAARAFPELSNALAVELADPGDPR